MSKIKEYAEYAIRTEAEAVLGLIPKLTDDFEKTVKAILASDGKVIITGMGKSGIVGKKIAATLASTGTPAFFMHPGEAYHGDLGMIEPRDVVIAIANSGQTDEILKLIPFLEHNGNVVIAMTGHPESPLARHARYHLDIGVDHEACPLNLAPTSSTTATLVMGDALAVALLEERNFRAEDYAVFHPGGSLGRRLLTRVQDVMRRESLPLVAPDTPLGDVILVISNARMGISAVVENGKLAGVITDGDVRRAMAKYKENFFTIRAREVMTAAPKTIRPEERIVVAEQMMCDHKIHSLVVVDPGNEVVGIIEFFNVSLA